MSQDVYGQMTLTQSWPIKMDKILKKRHTEFKSNCKYYKY